MLCINVFFFINIIIFFLTGHCISNEWNGQVVKNRKQTSLELISKQFIDEMSRETMMNMDCDHEFYIWRTMVCFTGNIQDVQVISKNSVFSCERQGSQNRQK